MAPPPAYRPGQVRADAARAAYAYILSAAAAAQNHRLDAIVTAPISKEAFPSPASASPATPNCSPASPAPAATP
jgi:4-hydroxy-L-threonine phosphate dehydrogenase PdxA